MGLEKTIDLIGELGFNVLTENAKKLHNERELKNRIKEFIELEYKTKIEKLSKDSEVDFAGLCNYINANFPNDVKGYLLNPEHNIRERYYLTIINKSIQYAQTKNTSLVKSFIDNVLDIIVNFYSNNLKEDDIFRENRIATDVITNVKDEIHKVGDNLSKKIDNLASTQQVSKKQENKSSWINQSTGEKLDPEKIYQKGIIKAKIDGDMAYAEYMLPDGKTTYGEFDIKRNAVMNVKYAYPLSEYKLDIPDKLVVKEEASTTTNGIKNFPAKIIHLKWGKRVVISYENGQLVDIDINTRTIINDTDKVIQVLDYTNEVNKI